MPNSCKGCKHEADCAKIEFITIEIMHVFVAAHEDLPGGFTPGLAKVALKLAQGLLDDLSKPAAADDLKHWEVSRETTLH